MQKHDQPKGRAAVFRAASGAEQAHPLRKLSDVVGDAENRAEHGGPEANGGDRRTALVGHRAAHFVIWPRQ